MYSSSVFESFGSPSGRLYMINQNASQMNPSAPVIIKASYHPHATTISGTINGVASAPIFVPELKMPVASARSFFGYHSETVLIDAGKFPASPRPKRKRATMKPTTETDSVTLHGAIPTKELNALNAPTTPFTIGTTTGDIKVPSPTAHAWSIAAKLQTMIARANPILVPIRSISLPTNSKPIAYAVWNEKTIQ